MLIIYNDKVMSSSIFPFNKKDKNKTMRIVEFLDMLDVYNFNPEKSKLNDVLDRYFNWLGDSYSTDVSSILRSEYEEFLNNKKNIFLRHKRENIRDSRTYKLPYFFRYTFSQETKDKIEKNLDSEFYDFQDDSQLNALYIKNKKYEESVKCLSNSITEKENFLNDINNVMSMISVICHYITKVNLRNGIIKPRFLPEFMMVIPCLLEYKNPVFEYYKDTLYKSILASRFETDNTFSIGGTVKDGYNVFLTKGDLKEVLGVEFKDIKAVQAVILLCFMIFPCLQKEVNGIYIGEYLLKDLNVGKDRSLHQQLSRLKNIPYLC